MNSWVLSSSPFLVSLFFIFFFVIKIPLSLCDEDMYESCSNTFNCGKLKKITFPFWGDNRPNSCGYPGLKLNCQGSVATIKIMNVTYQVLGVNPETQILKITREDFSAGICSPELVNSTLDPTLLDFGIGLQNLTIVYGCDFSWLIPFLGQFNCQKNGFSHIKWGAFGPGECKVSVVVPVPVQSGLLTGIEIEIVQSILEEAIREGFDVKWKVDTAACLNCTAYKGVCGYDLKRNQSTCYYYSSPDQKSNVPLGVGIGIAGAAIAGIFLGFFIFSIRKRKKRRAQESKSKDLPTPPSSTGGPASSNFARSIPSYPYSKSDLEKGSTYFGAQIFSYDELEEATNNFDTSRELGDGGFGTVYYGKLHDGRVVAVKRLYENNLKRVEQFMNEVEILTKIRHKNLVTLYGCTSKRSRELLLVYEYIPNGTVADHLHGNRSKSGLLTWPVRLSIAIESAEALAYLHVSDVIHRDVKTNNILLDEKFQVKVADFGLSRLFPTDVTHVSTAPQGTPGYVDPEYYQCYQLTDKSDVYSFGVVLIELISSLPAVDTNRHRHDINLSNMAVNKIQNHALHELVDPYIGFEKDYTVKRMTTSVAELAFRCLQQERDMRPSMDEVLEILRGIQNEEIGAQKAEVVDIRAADDVGLLKNIPPPLSPDSVVNDKWVSSSTPPNSF
ncbi:LEAF RUST 10 DISEASE-RESISTANCE LOCUS RECEPTOR-LIKE PROTEIN KINASE-like 1.3 isoform X3 [Quercus lobata]|uniref:LEAF RUST 10 DISEASE-RESISTANCE LOCUS RECEPTOR-LIKE PROTEIN KINASE-like 1.3 isoform X3 n=1 Tax=Quercus lobata TaxID=97700 RepID=UPI001246352B|nr:LEAF RUST 10 DISEASE-RESISTANCE LOCUS RECEPTOR-LIKE PROTEIN KINASE-like 1.3 isoform X3 [Quercus lobata]